jgi:hypothetical protein
MGGGKLGRKVMGTDRARLGLGIKGQEGAKRLRFRSSKESGKGLGPKAMANRDFLESRRGRNEIRDRVGS